MRRKMGLALFTPILIDLPTIWPELDLVLTKEVWMVKDESWDRCESWVGIGEQAWELGICVCWEVRAWTEAGPVPFFAIIPYSGAA